MNIDNISNSLVREGSEEKTEELGERKKRGRRKKNEEQKEIEIKDQNKFMVDVSKDLNYKEQIINLLKQANEKEYGREIQFKDIVFILLSKVNQKDIEKLQENSLTDKEKVQKAHIEFNRKNNTNLSYEEFLIKRLGIN